jgi:peptidoglycan/LPS O-acetylase OafA/YrhL
VARIWRGLLVMLFITTWILGSVVTTLPLERYLSDSDTMRYFAGSASLLPVWDLPGVFRTNPGPGVNGSVWSLPIEVTAYAGLALLGPLGAHWWRIRANAIALLAGVMLPVFVFLSYGGIYESVRSWVWPFPRR